MRHPPLNVFVVHIYTHRGQSVCCLDTKGVCMHFAHIKQRPPARVWYSAARFVPPWE